MTSKFFSIITGKGMNRQISQQGDDHLFDSFFGSLVNQTHAQRTTIAIYQGHDSALFTFPNHRIRFPVTDTFSPFHNLRPLFNALPIRDNAAIISVLCAFSVFFLSTKVFMKSAMVLFVFPNMLIDLCMTDLDAMLPPDPVGCLLRA